MTQLLVYKSLEKNFYSAMFSEMFSSMFTPLLNTVSDLTSNIFKSSESSSANISSLPTELIVKIFSNLDEKSLTCVQGTCHGFKNIVQTHRYSMRPCNIGTLDVVLKDDDTIDYIKHSIIYTGTIQINRPLKYKGTSFKLDHAIISNLNIIMHQVNENSISKINLFKVKAKKIHLKFMCPRSNETDILLDEISAKLLINQCNSKLQISFMQEKSSISIVKCPSNDKLMSLL